jgi:uncharacterized protein (TIGR01319 family)
MADPCALLIDFGSTYTKLRAVDLEEGRVLGTGQGPSTVASDITLGLEAALADLEDHLGRLPAFRHRLACSSAAGGLRMVTVGLVPQLTAEAARQAALGAGARLVGTFAYELTAGDVAAILELAPDILLLAGGTDGGNSAFITGNAAALAESALACPVVVAGNRSAAEGVARTLRQTGKSVLVSDNVMPEFNRLEVEPARRAIRRVFIERIVHAKGIDRAAAMFDQVLMPTPAAVLEGARLLADGIPGEAEGLGPLLVVDIGGATTDVHSICDGAPICSGVVFHGLPEPYAKRTVEGDLGMRHNARSIVEAAGPEAVAAASGLDAETVEALLTVLAEDVERLPRDGAERAFDQALAEAAARVSVTRHAGRVERVYTPTGPVTIQHGKSLSDVAAVIGTGGVLAHGADPAAVLRTTLADPAEPLSLRPIVPRLLLDGAYVLFACGLLAELEPKAAFALGRAHLVALEGEAEDGHNTAAG